MMALGSDVCGEVLRYMVQEKKVLHRDISFGNVLINPVQKSVQTTTGSSDSVQVDTKGEIPHTYRFIRDLIGDGFVFSLLIDTNVDGALTHDVVLTVELPLRTSIMLPTSRRIPQTN